MDCRSDSEGKTDEGSGYNNRNVKKQPLISRYATASPQGEALNGRVRMFSFMLRGISRLGLAYVRNDNIDEWLAVKKQHPIIL